MNARVLRSGAKFLLAIPFWALQTSIPVAASSMDDLIGSWSGTVRGPCREVTLNISKVESDGKLQGTFYCKAPNRTIVLDGLGGGDRVVGMYSKGWVHLSGMGTSGFDLSLSRDILEGLEWLEPQSRLTYVKFHRK